VGSENSEKLLPGKDFFITQKGEREMNQNKTQKKVIITVSIFAVAIVALLLIYLNFKPEPVKGAKKLEITVVIPEEATKDYTLNTDAEYLRQALEEADLIKGTESEYGLFITEVTGRVADDTKQEWWCITKDGAQIYNGVDQIAIADGEHYEITLTSGY
jgi:hypothetical protein